MARPFIYDPINTLKPVAEELWIVDGPEIRMAYGGVGITFPTRMTVVRLSSGDLWLHSPTAIDASLRDEVAALGPVRHLVSPNRIHYASIAAWKRAFPGAIAWASPGVRERAASQKIDVTFDRDLGDAADPAWADDLDQVLFRGSRLLEEVVFFHRRTRTALLADLIENFEPDRLGPLFRVVARLGGVLDPDGQTPRDLRATYLGAERHRAARACLDRVLAWHPERVILGHGRWYERDGERELRRGLRFLLG